MMGFYEQFCMNCRYWEQHADRDGGKCRRHAPRACLMHEADSIPYWPITRAKEWCGDHAPSKIKGEDEQ